MSRTTSTRNLTSDGTGSLQLNKRYREIKLNLVSLLTICIGLDKIVLLSLQIVTVCVRGFRFQWRLMTNVKDQGISYQIKEGEKWSVSSREVPSGRESSKPKHRSDGVGRG